MKTKKKTRLVAGLVVITTCLFGAGCGTKGGGGETSSSGGVKTGRGIEGNTITLGSLTDLTGVFAALGKDITNSQALYWSRQEGLRQVHRQARRQGPRLRRPAGASRSTARCAATCSR